MSIEQQYAPKILSDYLGDSDALNFCKYLIKSGLMVAGTPVTGLFISGQPGCGKTCLVEAFTRTLFCTNRPEGSDQACGECNICKAEHIKDIPNALTFTASTGPLNQQFLDELLPYYQSNVIGGSRIDQKKWLIYIDEAQRFSYEAISRLLDPLQSSGSNVITIFTTMDPDKLDPVVLDAISSRCVEFRLSPPEPQLIASKISEYYPNIDKTCALEIVKLCKGNIRLVWQQVTKLLVKYVEEQVISSEDIYELVVGGASKTNRLMLWLALNRKDYKSAQSIVSDWVQQGASLSSLYDLLVEDIFQYLHLQSSRTLLRDLGIWKMRNPTELGLISTLCQNLDLGWEIKMIEDCQSLTELIEVVS